MAETIKHAVIQDSKFFTHLENDIDAINPDEKLWEKLVHKTIKKLVARLAK